MSKYYRPVYRDNKFNCPLCSVYAKQEWGRLIFQENNALSPFHYSTCTHCNEKSFWYEEKLLVPMESGIPRHHEEMPSSCIDIYNEARSVAESSPKAAAALIRLLIQSIMIELGLPGKNLSEDISTLVKKGLPEEVQKALDYCRVIGNNAVHPGEINYLDNSDTVISLFEMVNFIVDDRIFRQNKITQLYNNLPEAIRGKISKRDNSK